MVWPIMRGKSYADETGKSMKAVGLAVAQRDSWRDVNYPDCAPSLAFPLWDYFRFARHPPAIGGKRH